MAVALLALPACDIFDMGAIRAGQADFATGTVIHDGGSIADNCVLDVTVTGATIVGLAASPPAGAIGVVLGWSLFGWTAASTIDACFNTWSMSVVPNLYMRGLAYNCWLTVGPSGYTNCVMYGFAWWLIQQAVWNAGQQLSPF